MADRQEYIDAICRKTGKSEQQAEAFIDMIDVAYENPENAHRGFKDYFGIFVGQRR